MNNAMQLKPIGVVKAENGFAIQLDKAFIPALKNIAGFSHLQVLWWGHLSDSDEERQSLTFQKPYCKGPEEVGVFATRAEVRPNPILITNIDVLHIDQETGTIHIPYIDAANNSPVLDIKPYHFSERVKDCEVPDWCKHWPQNHEDTASFDWEQEFNF